MLHFCTIFFTKGNLLSGNLKRSLENLLVYLISLLIDFFCTCKQPRELDSDDRYKWTKKSFLSIRGDNLGTDIFKPN